MPLEGRGFPSRLLLLWTLMVCVLSSPAVCLRGEKVEYVALDGRPRSLRKILFGKVKGVSRISFDSKTGAIYLRLGEKRSGQGEAVATVRAPDCIILSAR